MKLAFHYEMTILARLEDRLEISKDELLHEIGPIGMRAGVEETEKIIIEEHGKPEEKASIRDESIISSVTKEVVDVSTKAVNEISEELIDEPIFEEPEFGEEIFDPEMENFEEDFIEQIY